VREMTCTTTPRGCFASEHCRSEIFVLISKSHNSCVVDMVRFEFVVDQKDFFI
jgi:hypothetical protein